MSGFQMSGSQMSGSQMSISQMSGSQMSGSQMSGSGTSCSAFWGQGGGLSRGLSPKCATWDPCLHSYMMEEAELMLMS